MFDNEQVNEIILRIKKDVYLILDYGNTQLTNQISSLEVTIFVSSAVTISQPCGTFLTLLAMATTPCVRRASGEVLSHENPGTRSSSRKCMTTGP